MSKSSEAVISWRNRTKTRIVQSFGGKCGICEYAKCNDAFDLHHIDPAQKEFSLGSIRAWPKSWSRIVTELRKCVLLCCRCHREVHAGILSIDASVPRFDETFSEYKKLKILDEIEIPRRKCQICDNLTDYTNRICSPKCAVKLRKTYKWDDINLHELYVVKNQSISSIAKRIGCSNTSVVKRLKKLNLHNSKVG